MENVIPKAYDASKVEDAIYKKWEESGFFAPEAHQPWADNPKKRKAFSIVLPPPNATGTLHLGHAMYVIEDVMMRFQRMQGKKTLWIPGTDHAAIATNAKVERILNKEGKTRFEIGREAFVKKIEEYIAGSQGIIKKQLRKMGFSLDWSRECYTLDEKRTFAVQTAFKKMYDLGLIYRGVRVINWDPQAMTTIADDEIVYKEIDAKFYTFRYSKDFPIPISTTRPETKVGDTAVAVHPEGKWKEFIGKMYTIENFAGAKLVIKVIGDEAVVEEFGTGALGVTPAHSIIDFELSKKHNVPLIEVIDKEGKMTAAAGNLVAHMKAGDAREKIVQWLKENNLMEKEEFIRQNISTSERTGAVIEPLPMRQWFVNVTKPFPYNKSKRNPIKGLKSGESVTLKQLMQDVVKTGQIQIIPKGFIKTYFYWIDNLRDWNISRQIWFGHRIPVWYCKPPHPTLSPEGRGDSLNLPRPNGERAGGEGECPPIVSVEKPKICPMCGGTELEQDPDVLDTWFSSGLWTFSALGWPNKTKDLKIFHPTDVLETGYDILFFWVARMILFSTCLLGEVPFRTVYLHGLVRDTEGKKMSKSFDNVIDPLDVCAKYGTDAVRLSLLLGNAPGNDLNLGEDKIAGFRNFTNKLWNISRFVFTAVENVHQVKKAPKPKTFFDSWILKVFENVKSIVSQDLEAYEFSQAGESLRDFTWNKFADWFLEIAKIEKDKDEILLYILQNLLILWHPFMPFVTEEIWKNFNSKELLMIQKWPEENEELYYQHNSVLTEFNLLTEKDQIENIQNIIIAIRNLKAENKLANIKDVNVVIVSKKQEKILEDAKVVMEKLSGSLITFSPSKPQKSHSTVIGKMEIHLVTEAKIDIQSAKKEIEEKERYIQTLEKKLSNAEFFSKAPKEIVEKEKQKLALQKEELGKLKGNLG